MFPSFMDQPALHLYMMAPFGSPDTELPLRGWNVNESFRIKQVVPIARLFYEYRAWRTNDYVITNQSFMLVA